MLSNTQSICLVAVRLSNQAGQIETIEIEIDFMESKVKPPGSLVHAFSTRLGDAGLYQLIRQFGSIEYQTDSLHDEFGHPIADPSEACAITRRMQIRRTSTLCAAGFVQHLLALGNNRDLPESQSFRVVLATPISRPAARDSANASSSEQKKTESELGEPVESGQLSRRA